MLKENNPLLKLDIKVKKSYLSSIIFKVLESFYSLFDLILEDPLENFWYEIVSIILGYIQILYYLIDKTVSTLFINI
jgi:hypothetical protein